MRSPMARRPRARQLQVGRVAADQERQRAGLRAHRHAADGRVEQPVAARLGALRDPPRAASARSWSAGRPCASRRRARRRPPRTAPRRARRRRHLAAGEQVGAARRRARRRPRRPRRAPAGPGRSPRWGCRPPRGCVPSAGPSRRARSSPTSSPRGPPGPALDVRRSYRTRAWPDHRTNRSTPTTCAPSSARASHAGRRPHQAGDPARRPAGGQPPAAERELAAQLGIARSSLREAIHVLVHLNILEARHGQGTFVTDLRPALLDEPMDFALSLDALSVLDLFECRTVVECGTAPLAVARITRRAGRGARGPPPRVRGERRRRAAVPRPRPRDARAPGRRGGQRAAGAGLPQPARDGHGRPPAGQRVPRGARAGPAAPRRDRGRGAGAGRPGRGGRAVGPPAGVRGERGPDAARRRARAPASRRTRDDVPDRDRHRRDAHGRGRARGRRLARRGQGAVDAARLQRRRAGEPRGGRRRDGHERGRPAGGHRGLRQRQHGGHQRHRAALGRTHRRDHDRGLRGHPAHRPLRAPQRRVRLPPPGAAAADRPPHAGARRPRAHRLPRRGRRAAAARGGRAGRAGAARRRRRDHRRLPAVVVPQPRPRAADRRGRSATWRRACTTRCPARCTP